MRKGYSFYVACILIAAALLGIVSVFLSGLLALGFTRYQVIFLRSALSCTLLGAFMLAKNKEQFRFKLRDIWCFIGTGVLNQLLFCICYYTAIGLIGVAVASVLMFTSPIFAIVLSVILFHERIGKREILALVLAMSGCVLVSGIGGEQRLPLAGLLFGLGSGLAYALGGIFNKLALQHGYSFKTITFYTLLFCMGGVMPVAIAQPFPTVDLPDLPSTAGLLLCMSLLCSIIPTSLLVVGQKMVSPGRASMLTSTELAVAALVGIFVFHETLTSAALLGMLLITAAVILLAKDKEGT